MADGVAAVTIMLMTLLIVLAAVLYAGFTLAVARLLKGASDGYDVPPTGSRLATVPVPVEPARRSRS